jgi:heptaprenylglyceryl phosphate synthase
MPLRRLSEEYVEQDGVRFLMADEDDSTVTCMVSHEALRNHADRVHFSGTDGAVFEAYRELIEDVASNAFDAEGPFDDHGRILVTSEALARVMRSA